MPAKKQAAKTAAKSASKSVKVVPAVAKQPTSTDPLTPSAAPEAHELPGQDAPGAKDPATLADNPGPIDEAKVITGTSVTPTERAEIVSRAQDSEVSTDKVKGPHGAGKLTTFQRDGARQALDMPFPGLESTRDALEKAVYAIDQGPVVDVNDVDAMRAYLVKQLGDDAEM